MRERATLNELFPPFGWLQKAHPTHARGVERVWRLYRDFGAKVVAPAASALDEVDAAELHRLQRDLLAQACRWRLFSATIPVVYGGLGLPLLGVLPGLEELARHCAGIANLVSVHGLGLSVVGATGNLRILGELCRRLVTSEASGVPELIATAATEPSAGTDVENVELLGIARLVSAARPVSGGYLLSGQKIFISNGSLARHIVVLMPTDPAAPAATTKAFWVRSGSPGYAVENVESKMGQRACPAATLGFHDCFVPEEDCIGPIGGRELDLILGATRGAVAAYGAGIATAALDRAFGWAEAALDRHGRRYLDAQWVKQGLAEIQQCAWQARAAYWSAAAANDGFGLSSLMSVGRQQAQHWLPRRVVDTDTARSFLASRTAEAAARLAISTLPEWKLSLATAWGAGAKVMASDSAVRACELALEITGNAGLRRELGLEKLLRDAKLLQIYEGTNELNRLEVFARVTGGSLLSIPQASHAAATPSLHPDAALVGRPADPELDELVNTVERWLVARTGTPCQQGSRARRSTTDAETLAELMALGAPHLASVVDDDGSSATPAEMAHVLLAFGRHAAELGALLLAHWLANGLAPDCSGQQVAESWCAFPLYSELRMPAETLRVEPTSLRLRGRVGLVVGAAHAESLVLPVQVEGSGAPRWCRIPRVLPGVRIAAPALTLGLAGTGACDVEVDIASAHCPPELLNSEPAECSVRERTVGGWATACAAALCLGVLEASAALTGEHVTMRRQGGSVLVGHDAIADMLGTLSVDLTTISSALSALLQPSLNDPARVGLLLSSRSAVLRGTDIGIRALGGYGYLTSYAQEKRYRDARQLCEILGNSAELRLQLRDLLGGVA